MVYFWLDLGTELATLLSLFCLQVSTLHIFLMEVTITVATATLAFILKCENPGQARAFIKHFLETLVGNRWLSQH